MHENDRTHVISLLQLNIGISIGSDKTRHQSISTNYFIKVHVDDNRSSEPTTNCDFGEIKMGGGSLLTNVWI